MLTILVIFGSLLDGAKLGVNFYVGDIDWSKFSEPKVWKAAVSVKKIYKQSFF